MKKFLVLFLSFLILAGTLAQKMTEVKPQALPKPVTDYIHRNFPGATISHAVKVEDKGKMTYNIALDVKGKKQILLFDKDGKFLRKGENILDNKPAAKEKEGLPVK